MLHAAALIVRRLRIAMVVLLGLSITHCSPLPAPVPRLDLSDEEHMLISIQHMEEALPDDQRETFERALQRLVTSLTLQDINRWAAAPSSAPILSLTYLNGLSAEEVMAKARQLAP